MSQHDLTEVPVGARVLLAGMRRTSTTRGEVVAHLRNGWVVVDFPSWCWVGEPGKLELLDESIPETELSR
jgi:hypothetical protein